VSFKVVCHWFCREIPDLRLNRKNIAERCRRLLCHLHSGTNTDKGERPRQRFAPRLKRVRPGFVNPVPLHAAILDYYSDCRRLSSGEPGETLQALASTQRKTHLKVSLSIYCFPGASVNVLPLSIRAQPLARIVDGTHPKSLAWRKERSSYSKLPRNPRDLLKR
jgi:hypothetical protein